MSRATSDCRILRALVVRLLKKRILSKNTAIRLALRAFALCLLVGMILLFRTVRPWNNVEQFLLYLTYALFFLCFLAMLLLPSFMDFEKDGW